MTQRIRASKYGRTRANLFEVLTTIKVVAIELAATVVFLVWLYKELIHELR